MRRMFLKDNLPYPPLIQEITILEVVIKISVILRYKKQWTKQQIKEKKDARTKQKQ